ncbi:site-2 protease family protein [Undibacterium sp.]|uniref:site-2 protease family protein n=1 Tax=Undibacterium sp. TaxID=1914977 RepID=UPI00374DA41F
MDELIQAVAAYALPIIFAITLHEAAHAFAAKYFGDLTAYQQGRMTLNPMSHIDIVGTIIIPIILFLSLGVGFGYAKPVPVKFGNLRHPKRDMAWVALAGPAANLFMALLWLILLQVLPALGVNELFLIKMAHGGVVINLAMFAFNLFPIPPLDGGRIAVSLLPYKYAFKFAQIEPYGFFIVMGLAMLPIFDFWGFWMSPVMKMAESLLSVLVIPLVSILS